MRIIYALLAVWITCMSVMPCMEGLGVNNGNHETLMIANDSNSNSSDNDICSPFCVCQCGQFVSMATVPKPVQAIKEYSPNYSLVPSPLKSKILFDIFHPPKQA